MGVKFVTSFYTCNAIAYGLNFVFNTMYPKIYYVIPNNSLFMQYLLSQHVKSMKLKIFSLFSLYYGIIKAKVVGVDFGAVFTANETNDCSCIEDAEANAPPGSRIKNQVETATCKSASNELIPGAK
jgi:hypothetical protein